jgi:hypothetical protein
MNTMRGTDIETWRNSANMEFREIALTATGDSCKPADTAGNG